MSPDHQFPLLCCSIDFKSLILRLINARLIPRAVDCSPLQLQLLLVSCVDSTNNGKLNLNELPIDFELLSLDFFVSQKKSKLSSMFGWELGGIDEKNSKLPDVLLLLLRWLSIAQKKRNFEFTLAADLITDIERSSQKQPKIRLILLWIVNIKNEIQFFFLTINTTRNIQKHWSHLRYL